MNLTSSPKPNYMNSIKGKIVKNCDSDGRPNNNMSTQCVEKKIVIIRNLKT